MKFNRIGCSLLETVPICLAVLLVCVGTDDRSYMKPFGITMCEQLCQSISECTTYMFLMSDLSCHVSNISYTTVLQDKKEFLHNISQKTDIQFEDQSCGRQVRMFFSRKRHPVCERRPAVTNVSSNGTRLLIATFGKKAPMIQFHLKGHRIQRYPHITPVAIRALAYIWSTRQIVVATDRQIQSHHLDKYMHVVLVDNVRCHFVVADEERNLVFLYCSSITGVIKITKGKKYTKIYSVANNRLATGIAVLPKPGKLFLSNSHEIVLITYDGTYFNPLVIKIKHIKGITADTSHNVIYLYNVRKQILGMSASGHVTGVLRSLKQHIQTIVHHQNRWFIQFYGRKLKDKGLWKFDLLTKIRTRLLSTQYFLKYRLVFCVIP